MREIRAELCGFDDALTQYAFLTELSAYVPVHQPELTTEEHLYRGCQSQVWLSLSERDGLFAMSATSDTLIIRGVLYVMMELYNGCSVKEIAARPVDFLREAGIADLFPSERIAGIGGINREIQRFCARISGKYGTA